MSRSTAPPPPAGPADLPDPSDPPGAAGAPGFRRDAALARLATEQFDVLVVGGGITGAGVALDAASRGLRTALVEQVDFASGTSSKSSKMVHGGLRYLQQHEIRLVYENLAERQRLLENAPHLVSPLPFLIPLFGRDGVVAKAVARSYATALWLYDLTGGVRIGARHRRVGKQEALAHLPTLRADRLVAGFLYFDARADDARLTLALLRTAVLDYGAVAVNHAPAVGFSTDGAGRVDGALVQPRPQPGGATPRELHVRARVVVNASGVWADEVRRLDGDGGSDGDGHAIRPAKGVHVTVPAAKLPCDVAAVVPVPSDRRSVFVVPWPETDLVYVGTTDTDYDGPLDDPACTGEDVDYLLRAVNAVTTSSLDPSDVTGVWAGLRPLLAPGHHGRRQSARTADLSRRHTVRTSPHGVVTVTGGKLTTYRRMAEDAMAEVVRHLPPGRPAGRCVTRHLPLRGAPSSGRRRPARDGVGGRDVSGRDGGAPGPGDPGSGGPGPGGPAPGDPIGAHLWARYGTEAAAVRALADGRPELLAPLVDGLPYLAVEVVHAARAEMATSVDDVLSRRTRARLLDARRSVAAAPAVAALLAEELGWSPEVVEEQVTAYAAAVDAELSAAGLPAEGRPDTGLPAAGPAARRRR